MYDPLSLYANRARSLAELLCTLLTSKRCSVRPSDEDSADLGANTRAHMFAVVECEDNQEGQRVAEALLPHVRATIFPVSNHYPGGPHMTRIDPALRLAEMDAEPELVGCSDVVRSRAGWLRLFLRRLFVATRVRAYPLSQETTSELYEAVDALTGEYPGGRDAEHAAALVAWAEDHARAFMDVCPSFDTRAPAEADKAQAWATRLNIACGIAGFVITSESHELAALALCGD